VKIIQTDCLVLGAGLAGSTYALRAARAGFRVDLLSLGEPLQAVAGQHGPDHLEVSGTGSGQRLRR